MASGSQGGLLQLGVRAHPAGMTQRCLNDLPAWRDSEHILPGAIYTFGDRYSPPTPPFPLLKGRSLRAGLKDIAWQRALAWSLPGRGGSGGDLPCHLILTLALAMGMVSVSWLTGDPNKSQPRDPGRQVDKMTSGIGSGMAVGPWCGLHANWL